MKNKYSDNLFNSIKESLNSKKTESSFGDFLKLEKNKTYIVRLVPNVINPERTFFPYFSHTWESVVTSSLVNVHCPNTYGEKCPIDEYRSRIYKSKNEKEIEKTGPLRRNQNTLVKAYVIKDPTNPENEGQVKILRFGKQLEKIITSAMSGDESDEFGVKVFDLSSDGCNLKIKVEENEGGYATYVASKFMNASSIPGLDDADAIYEQVLELDNIFQHQSYDEIQGLLNKHWLGIQTSTKASPTIGDDDDEEQRHRDIETIAKSSKAEQVSEEINFDTNTTNSKSSESVSDEDKAMQDILANL